jgi:hypothetical protein
MWDDIPGFIIGGVGTPTSTVADPDGTPNNILAFEDGGKVTVAWSFSGVGLGFLTTAHFSVQLWADPIGTGVNTLVGGVAVTVPGTVTVVPPAPQPYHATITIAPSSLPVGAYRLTALITTTNGGFSIPIAGFVDGPIIQVRPKP